MIRPTPGTPDLEILKGMARHVMRCLGKGHREAIYHSALITALNRERVPHRSEVPCPIWFMGECIGSGRADLVIGETVAEIKANRMPPTTASAQLQKYLQSMSRAEKRPFHGVIINFNQKTGMVDILEQGMAQTRAPIKPHVTSRFFAPSPPRSAKRPRVD
jgi:GxxExxY protein